MSGKTIFLVACLMFNVACITTILIVCAANGINGTVTTLGMSVISLISGYVIRKAMEKKKK